MLKVYLNACRMSVNIVRQRESGREQWTDGLRRKKYSRTLQLLSAVWSSLNNTCSTVKKPFISLVYRNVEISCQPFPSELQNSTDLQHFCFQNECNSYQHRWKGFVITAGVSHERGLTHLLLQWRLQSQSGHKQGPPNHRHT